MSFFFLPCVLPCVLSIDAYFQVFLYLSSGVNYDSWGCYLIRLMVFLWKVIDNSWDLGELFLFQIIKIEFHNL